MARPPKYHWESVDQLIDAGKGTTEISKLTGIPDSTISSRRNLLREQRRYPDPDTVTSEMPYAITPEIVPKIQKPHPDEVPVDRTPLAEDLSDKKPETPNTPRELAAIGELNRVLTWLDRLDKAEKNNAVLVQALQAKIGRYLERNPDLRACDINNIASAMATLGTLGRGSDELGLAIQTFMKFGLFDRNTSAYLTQAISDDREASLSKIRQILSGDRESLS